MMQLQPIKQNTMVSMQATTYLIHKNLFHNKRPELKPEFSTCALANTGHSKRKKRWSTLVSNIFPNRVGVLLSVLFLQTEANYFCFYCFFKQRWSTFFYYFLNRGELLLFPLIFQTEVEYYISSIFSN